MFKRLKIYKFKRLKNEKNKRTEKFQKDFKPLNKNN